MSEDKTELDGMVALAQGVAEQRWPHTMDAQVWAKEFMKQPSIVVTEEVMLGWFANAIMAGYDTATHRNAQSTIPREWWERLKVRVYGFEAVNIKHLYSMMDDIERGGE